MSKRQQRPKLSPSLRFLLLILKILKILQIILLFRPASAAAFLAQSGIGTQCQPLNGLGLFTDGHGIPLSGPNGPFGRQYRFYIINTIKRKKTLAVFVKNSRNRRSVLPQLKMRHTVVPQCVFALRRGSAPATHDTKAPQSPPASTTAA